ncbi:MipA/OmpV family protein [Cohaesibacter celericrescens]|uniref:MipA/OmpV family protein n=1 Tax=Cohaesibacter celericrescens TaxID=2067669 RepID=A0A2N5XKK7_9HYPH|nr:MipA/OmpV family protein [Cohaesibacter celericrescens]PLW75051.1 hypothetical protein C0081_22400 [Cohaesibacter celericrescens]
MFEKKSVVPSRFLGVGAVALMLSLKPVQAEDVFSTLMAGGLTDASYWDVTLGGGVMIAPKYQGSKKFSATPLPYVDVVWKDTLFLNPMKGLGANIFSSNGFKFGAAASYDFGRKEKDSRTELAGMGKIKGGVTATGFLDYDLGFVKASSSLTKYFAGSKGVTADFGLKTFVPLSVLMGGEMPQGGPDKSVPGHGFTEPALSLGVSAQWADKDYMQDYFGVTAAQSATSGYATHKASAGFKSVSAQAGLYVPVTEHVIIGSTVTYRRLVGDAAESPLSKRDNQVSGMIFTTYKF